MEIAGRARFPRKKQKCKFNKGRDDLVSPALLRGAGGQMSVKDYKELM
jgi:hypothetical protein